MSPDVDWADLRSKALASAGRGYAAYSGLQVGAAGLTDTGETVVGCNVENASYGVTLCAECSLVGNLRLSGGSRLVAVSVCDSDGRRLLPCGRCRQLLMELGGARLMVDSPDGPIALGALLPRAFGPQDLPPPR